MKTAKCYAGKSKQVTARSRLTIARLARSRRLTARISVPRSSMRVIHPSSSAMEMARQRYGTIRRPRSPSSARLVLPRSSRSIPPAAALAVSNGSRSACPPTIADRNPRPAAGRRQPLLLYPPKSDDASERRPGGSSRLSRGSRSIPPPRRRWGRLEIRDWGSEIARHTCGAAECPCRVGDCRWKSRI